MSNDTVRTWVGAEVKTIRMPEKRVITTRGHPVVATCAETRSRFLYGIQYLLTAVAL